ncbi:hypothetical protein D9615_005936 [Tricholomella constricta]|uniref:Uncharacterized protein n=1 Tax=Tricholomella constricta TaxID=117010 RepID=A0A8H5M2V1_9AGAR|nr:hypothetical protein D9615_005936 [Tricholomella constricta]
MRVLLPPRSPRWFWGGAALAEIVDKYGGGGFSVDTKRPRSTIVAARLRLVARSNNSHAYEVHVMGATLENAFPINLILSSFLEKDHPAEVKIQTIFRLLKYAIRPVSLNSEPTKISFSALIVEDMTEFVRAHATYRFVILDEEDERPRILSNEAVLGDLAARRIKRRNKQKQNAARFWIGRGAITLDRFGVYEIRDFSHLEEARGHLKLPQEFRLDPLLWVSSFVLILREFRY